MAAFRATLEEVAGADLLLHVIDAATPGREAREAAVRRVLDEVDAAKVPRLAVYNKCDLLDEAEGRRLMLQEPGALLVSARTGEGRGELIEAITSRLALDVVPLTLRLDASRPEDRERIATLYRHGRVTQSVSHGDEVVIDAEVPRRLVERLTGGAPPGGAEG